MPIWIRQRRRMVPPKTKKFLPSLSHLKVGGTPVRWLDSSSTKYISSTVQFIDHGLQQLKKWTSTTKECYNDQT
uniref:Ovule protein n=1 Tax=Acrobeloides nanus TaxID=290746 RepID=A0A914CTT7_9BILA